MTATETRIKNLEAQIETKKTELAEKQRNYNAVNEALKRLYDREQLKVDEAIGEEMLLLAQGHISNIEEYKHHVGIIRGLEKAKDLIADANKYLQTGERDR